MPYFQRIPVTVEFTTSHLGWVEFNLCPNGESDDCLKENILNFSDGSSRYYVQENNEPVTHELELQLPESTLCESCVLQMTYHAGNNWGSMDKYTFLKIVLSNSINNYLKKMMYTACKNGTEGMGCGLQETFRNCMDIAIRQKSNRTSKSN